MSARTSWQPVGGVTESAARFVDDRQRDGGEVVSGWASPEASGSSCLKGWPVSPDSLERRAGPATLSHAAWRRLVGPPASEDGDSSFVRRQPGHHGGRSPCTRGDARPPAVGGARLDGTDRRSSRRPPSGRGTRCPVRHRSRGRSRGPRRRDAGEEPATVSTADSGRTAVWTGIVPCSGRLWTMALCRRLWSSVAGGLRSGGGPDVPGGLDGDAVLLCEGSSVSFASSAIHRWSTRGVDAGLFIGDLGHAQHLKTPAPLRHSLHHVVEPAGRHALHAGGLVS